MLISVIAAAVVGGAFLIPGSWASVLLGWLAAILIAVLARTETRLYRRLFLFGLILHGIGFYWLPATLSFFGGFPEPISYALFFLYMAVSSLQFVLAGWLLVRLRQTKFERYHLALPLAWFASEFLVPRLFPWAIADTQIAWSGFASLAEVFGTIPVGIVMLTGAEAAVVSFNSLRSRNNGSAGGIPSSAIAVFVLLVAMVIAGEVRSHQVAQAIDQSEKFKVGLIQGNLDPKSKRDVYQLETNLAQYAELSAGARADGAEAIFWPETVVTEWFPERGETVKGTRFAPFLNLDVPLIFGGLVYRLNDWTKPPQAAGQKIDQFNAAILVDAKKSVQGLYYKRVLMPFGEYMPFATLFPALKEISPNTGEFSFGDRSEPFVVQRRGVDPTTSLKPVKIGMLICYEDLLPWMTRDAALAGADLFAAVTNDAWYGDTAAPHQHNLLAAWRAIETRKPLLRVTNTGLTAMVTPLGQTTPALRTFVAAYEVADVPLLSLTTLYTRFGDIPSWIVSIAVLALCLRRSKRPAAT